MYTETKILKTHLKYVIMKIIGCISFHDNFLFFYRFGPNPLPFRGKTAALHYKICLSTALYFFHAVTCTKPLYLSFWLELLLGSFEETSLVCIV